MNRGTDHQPVFFDDRDRIEFGRRLQHIHDEHGVKTLAYCLMDNHVHLLLRAPPDALSPAMQHTFSVYTRHTNDRLGRDGPLLRGRFHSIPVETDAYVLTATRYIHRNPLALPGVTSPADHRWSSYRTYLGLRPAPAFVDLEPVSGLLGGPDGVRDFTEGDGVLPVPVPLRIEDILSLVELSIALDDLSRGFDERPRWLARTVLILVADRATDREVRDVIVGELRWPTRAAMRSALSRARRRLATDPMVQRIVLRVEVELACQRGSDPQRHASAAVAGVSVGA